MSMSDPIGDMLTRIRNAQLVKMATVIMPSSNIKLAIAKILLDEGYIDSFAVEADGCKRTLSLTLKYYQGNSVIEIIKRVSRPGRRIYRGKDDIPVVRNGLGITILSTSKGVMTDRQARKIGEGGEIIAFVA